MAASNLRNGVVYAKIGELDEKYPNICTFAERYPLVVVEGVTCLR